MRLPILTLLTIEALSSWAAPSSAVDAPGDRLPLAPKPQTADAHQFLADTTALHNAVNQGREEDLNAGGLGGRADPTLNSAGGGSSYNGGGGGRPPQNNGGWPPPNNNNGGGKPNGGQWQPPPNNNGGWQPPKNGGGGQKQPPQPYQPSQQGGQQQGGQQQGGQQQGGQQQGGQQQGGQQQGGQQQGGQQQGGQQQGGQQPNGGSPPVESFGAFGTDIALAGNNVKQRVMFAGAVGMFIVDYAAYNNRTLKVEANMSPAPAPADFNHMELYSYVVNIKQGGSGLSFSRIAYRFDETKLNGIDISRARLGKLKNQNNQPGFVVESGFGPQNFDATTKEIVLSTGDLNGEWALFAPEQGSAGKSIQVMQAVANALLDAR